MHCFLRYSLFIVFFFITGNWAWSQACTTLGQTPATAFPVCGTTTFRQLNVPICSTNSLFVPGCSGSGNADYENKNPFFYKFTCYETGTLGFVITPLDLSDDYDWQLYDITGIDPNEIFTNRNIVVSGNWAATPGRTGASATGSPRIECASDPRDNMPNFARMPTITAGREYLLLVSHYTNSQSGYTLAFEGGSAVITDPKLPQLAEVIPSCAGDELTIRFNKRILCSSLTPDGSDFSLPGNTILSAVSSECNGGFDFEEVTLKLSGKLTNGTHQLSIKKGTDNNTLVDNCDHAIPENEFVNFTYNIPEPARIDSLQTIGCAPNTLNLVFDKKVLCSSIASDGSNFSLNGPENIAITAAHVIDCSNDLGNIIAIQLAKPIHHAGAYTLNVHKSIYGEVILDECGLETLTQTISFSTADTVSAKFSFTNDLGCTENNLQFNHDGNGQTNRWIWNINGSNRSSQNVSLKLPANSSNQVQLIVSNGVCSDTTREAIILNNQVRASFNIPENICPEDLLHIENTSTGAIDSWQWKIAGQVSYTEQHPSPHRFLSPGRNMVTHQIQLIARNEAMNCVDSATRYINLYNHCYIAVPTAFTPNGDGLNDYLYPVNAFKALNLHFAVYNRWGELVFESSDWKKKWDGKYKNVEQASGVYTWKISYTHADNGEKIEQKGTTTLIR